jgi:hypothetical protein
MPECIRYVVNTKYGYLGLRRYSYKKGTNDAKSTNFEFARIFSRKHDAEASCAKGDMVVEVIVKTKES